MKKVLAIVLALVMAFSCAAMAFATEDAATTAAATTAATTAAATEAATEAAELTVKDVLNAIVELAKAGMTQWNDVESVVIKIIEAIDNLVNGITTGSVDGLVAELEGLVAGLELPAMDNLINTLKEKILSWYTPDIFVTEPVETPETGSAPVGIAVFAAVSVAAAAAFVCTKKN